MTILSRGKILSGLILGIPGFVAYLLVPYVSIEWLLASCCAIWVISFNLWILLRIVDIEESVRAAGKSTKDAGKYGSAGIEVLESISHEFLSETLRYGPYFLSRGESIRVEATCAGALRLEVQRVLDGGKTETIFSTHPTSRIERSTQGLAQGRYVVLLVPASAPRFPKPEVVALTISLKR